MTRNMCIIYVYMCNIRVILNHSKCSDNSCFIFILILHGRKQQWRNDVMTQFNGSHFISLTQILQQVLFMNVDIKAQTYDNTDISLHTQWITSHRESLHNNNKWQRYGQIQGSKGTLNLYRTKTHCWKHCCVLRQCTGKRKPNYTVYLSFKCWIYS